MKKLKKILLGILIFFIGVSYVYADTCSNIGSLTAQNDFDTHLGITIDGNAGEHKRYINYHIYKLKGNGKEYIAFCRNAGLNAGAEGKGETFTCNGTVSKSVSSAKNKAMNAGIIEIINNGYGKSGSSSVEYIATNVALRVFEMMWNTSYRDGLKRDGDPGINASLHRSLLNVYAKDSGIQSKVKQIQQNHSNWVKLSTEQGLYKYSGWSKSGEEINSRAIALLNIGLQAAIDSEDEKLTIYSWGEPIKGNKTSEDGKTIKSLKYNLEYSNADLDKLGTDNAPSFQITFNCPDCATKGVSYEILIDGTKKFDSNSNNMEKFELLDKDNAYITTSKKSVDIEVLFTVNNQSSLENCEDLEYEFTYKTLDSSDDTEVYMYQASGCNAAEGCQDFYVYNTEANTGNNGDDYITDVEKGTINLCNNQNCTELEKSCNEDKANGNPNSQNCQKYDNKCSQCNTYVSRTTCGIGDQTMDIIEGVDSTNTCTSKEEKDTNVFKCIIAPDTVADGSDGSEEKKDIGGNSYIANSSVGISSDNPYCSVACKENYHLTLPGVKDAQSGRYFTLTANINGNRTCYTSRIRKGTAGNLNSNQAGTFEYDYETTRQKLVEAYNWYRFFEILAGVTTSNDGTAQYEEHQAHWDYSYDGTYWYPPYNFNAVQYNCGTGPNPSVCGDYHEYNKSANVYNQKATFTLTGTHNSTYARRGSSSDPYQKMSELEWNPSVSTTTNGGNSISQSAVIKCNTSGTCTFTSNAYTTNEDGSHKADARDGLKISDLSNEINSKKQEWSSKINQYKTKLKQIYDWYLECTNWTNNVDYNFNPEVTFDYEEMSYRTEQVNMKMESAIVEEKNKKIETCNEKMGDKNYECTDWKSSVETKSINILTCTTSGCELETKEIPQTLEAKVTISTGAYYYPPIQYVNNFPTGALSLTHTAPDPNQTKYDDYFGHFVEVEDENGRIIGAWPIGLATNAGIFTYMLNIKNLGQYNDDGSLGRVWGGNNSHRTNKTVIEAAAADPGCLSQDRGWGSTGYACAYRVDINSPVYCQDHDTKQWLVCENEDGISDPAYCPPACDCGNNCDNYCYNYLTGEKVLWPSGTAMPSVCRCYFPYCPEYCFNYITGEKVPWPNGTAMPSVCLPPSNNPTDAEFNHIPTGDVKPNDDRQMGINWYDGDNPTTYLELKAYATIKEIEEDQETIYDVSFDTGTTQNNPDTTYALIVKLKGNTIRYIKNYNAEHADDGYANDSLTCYDYKKNDGEVYSSIFCYSELIDKLAEEFPNDVKFTKYRPLGNERENTSNYDYWTTWDNVSYKSTWTTSTDVLLEASKQSYKNNQGIGPAWK